MEQTLLTDCQTSRSTLMRVCVLASCIVLCVLLLAVDTTLVDCEVNGPW